MLLPKIIGIVNVTADSFSDGGRFLDPREATAHARRLAADGADVVELGPASSHPDAAEVSAEEEIRRIDPVISALEGEGLNLSVDTWRPETQRYCVGRGINIINDIEGFPERDMHAVLASAECQLVVMHKVQKRGNATREDSDASEILARIVDFFDARVAELVGAGVARERLILDPGMGFFLGKNPEPSLRVLANLEELRDRFSLPLLISVSRKSFLGSITGRGTDARGAAGLAAELHAAAHGAEYIRTHDARALKDALRITNAVHAERHEAAG